jgi:hypothetical protein
MEIVIVTRPVSELQQPIGIIDKKQLYTNLTTKPVSLISMNWPCSSCRPASCGHGYGVCV